MPFARNEHQIRTANTLAVECYRYLQERLTNDPSVHIADVAHALLLYSLRTHPHRVALAQMIVGVLQPDATDTYECPTCCDWGVIDYDTGTDVIEIDCPDCGK
jgi:hypothetical protein